MVPTILCIGPLQMVLDLLAEKTLKRFLGRRIRVGGQSAEAIFNESNFKYIIILLLKYNYNNIRKI